MDKIGDIVIVLFLFCVLVVYFRQGDRDNPPRPKPDKPTPAPGGTVIAQHSNGAYLVKARNRQALTDADRNIAGPHVVPAKGQPGVFAVSPDWGTAWEAAGTPNDKTPVSGMSYTPKTQAKSLRGMMEGDEYDYIQ